MTFLLWLQYTWICFFDSLLSNAEFQAIIISNITISFFKKSWQSLKSLPVVSKRKFKHKNIRYYINNTHTLDLWDTLSIFLSSTECFPHGKMGIWLLSGTASLYSAFANCWFTLPCTLTRKMALRPPLSSSQTSVVIQLESHSFLAQGTPGGTLYGYFCEWLQLKGKFKMLS